MAWTRALSGYCYFEILKRDKYPRNAWERVPAAFTANLKMNWPHLLHRNFIGYMLRMTANRNINNFPYISDE